TGRDLRSEAMSRLPIAASDLSVLATLAPGVVGIAETDSTRSTFSVAGQRPTANRVTLDGLSYGGTNNATALLRLDWNLAEAHTLTVRLDGRWNSDDPARVRSLAVPSTGGRRTERAGGVMASMTSHLGEQVINEVRGYVSVEHTDAGGFLALPEARVHVTSDLPDSIRGVATLTFGGNHAFPQHTDNTTAEVREEVSWLTQDATHRIKLGGYVNSVRLRANQTPNQ